MSYSAQITYPIYDLNSTLFVELVREVLEVEFLNQRTNHSKTFLPQKVETDNYLLNPISDQDIDPAFCAIIKANAENITQYFNQENLSNTYLIQVVAKGLENLRKITDAIYIILNDMFVKQYFFQYKNGDKLLISDSSKYLVKTITTDLETSKTITDQNIIMGNVMLMAEIGEEPEFNTTAPLTEIETKFKLGLDEKEVIQNTTF